MHKNKVIIFHFSIDQVFSLDTFLSKVDKLTSGVISPQLFVKHKNFGLFESVMGLTQCNGKLLALTGDNFKQSIIEDQFFKVCDQKLDYCNDLFHKKGLQKVIICTEDEVIKEMCKDYQIEVTSEL